MFFVMRDHITKTVAHYKKLVPVTHKLLPETRNMNNFFCRPHYNCIPRSYSHQKNLEAKARKIKEHSIEIKVKGNFAFAFSGCKKSLKPCVLKSGKDLNIFSCCGFYIGRSKGAPGTCASGLISFIFMQFSRKLRPNNRLEPHIGGWRSRLGNPGSATVLIF